MSTINTTALPAAPVAVTLYKWAAQTHYDLAPFKGSINADPRVQQAMCDYAMTRISQSGFFQDLDVLIKLLTEQAPLPTTFANFLDASFNQGQDSESQLPRNALLAIWLSPMTGKLPKIGTWEMISNQLNAYFELCEFDVQITEALISPEPYRYHWSKNWRIELILAAWLNSHTKYIEMPLYNHLPAINMQHPDEVTALFWTIVTQYSMQNPNKASTHMLNEWMQQHSEYNQFVQHNHALIENLMGDDAIICAKTLHKFWQCRHNLADPHLRLPSL